MQEIPIVDRVRYKRHFISKQSRTYVFGVFVFLLIELFSISLCLCVQLHSRSIGKKEEAVNTFKFAWKETKRTEKTRITLVFDSFFLLFLLLCYFNVYVLGRKRYCVCSSCLRMRVHVIIIKRVLSDTAHGIR